VAEAKAQIKALTAPSAAVVYKAKGLDPPLIGGRRCTRMIAAPAAPTAAIFASTEDKLS